MTVNSYIEAARTARGMPLEELVEWVFERAYPGLAS
jgi:hypothetical protein